MCVVVPMATARYVPALRNDTHNPNPRELASFTAFNSSGIGPGRRTGGP